MRTGSVLHEVYEHAKVSKFRENIKVLLDVFASLKCRITAQKIQLETLAVSGICYNSFTSRGSPFVGCSIRTFQKDLSDEPRKECFAVQF